MDIINRLLGRRLLVINFSDDQLNLEFEDSSFVNIFNKTSYRFACDGDSFGVVTNVNRSVELVSIELTQGGYVHIRYAPNDFAGPEAFVVRFPDVTYVDRGVED
jgi:hypothetical protein